MSPPGGPQTRESIFFTFKSGNGTWGMNYIVDAKIIGTYQDVAGFHL